MARWRCIRWFLAVLAGVAAASPDCAWANMAPTGPRLVVIRDAETETLLRTFATPLFRAAGLEPNLVRIIVIRDDAINSFVSTGNRMFIYSGLIEKAATAAQLVGVIAHETGHIHGGHLARLPEAMRQALVEQIAAVLVGAAAGVAARDAGPALGAAMGGSQLATRGLLAFTRGMEQSADQAAMDFLDQNRWSARGLLDLFQTLQDEQALAAGVQDPYVLTHPLTRDRIAFVHAHVAASPYRDAPLPAGWEAEYQMVRAKLRGFLLPSSVTLARMPAGDASDPARYQRAIALYRLGRTDAALSLLDPLIAAHPDDPWLAELKGQMLFDGGRVRDSVAPYRDAARLAPGQPLIRQAFARAMLESGDPLLARPALAQLQAAAEGERDDPFTWHELAVAWGRLGELGQANLALAENALLQGDIEGAHHFAATAEALLPPGPGRLRAQDIANTARPDNRE